MRTTKNSPPYKVTILLIGCFLFTNLLQAQLVEGILLSASDTSTIGAAHVINVSNNKMTTSNAAGYFKLLIKTGDTIIVSNINYVTRQLVIADQVSLSIYMKPHQIQLAEVVVTNMPRTASAFRNQVLDMDMQPTQAFIPYGMKPARPKNKVPISYDKNKVNTLSYAVNKPLSFIVKKLSKSYKAKVKYYETVANQGKLITNDKKFNREIVKQLTALEGENLSDFIKFMDVDAFYIQRSTEYEIALHIQAKFETYRDQLPASESASTGNKQG
jgi:co-chaperonin GroES (HSP10)